MSDHKVFDRIRDTLTNVQQFSAAHITPEATLESLGGDSLDDIELHMLLEDEFNIEIKEDSFDVNTPISEIVTLVEGLITHG